LKKITILTTTKNSWFLDYSKYLLQELNKNKKILVNFCKNQNMIQKSSYTFILSSNQIIKKKNLQKSEYNIVIHGSDLPKGRGHSPWSWDIEKGKKFIYLTMFLINNNSQKVDSGNILLKKKIKLKGTELIEDLRKLIIDNYVFMVKTYLKNSKKIKPQPQKGKATFYPKRSEKNQKLDIKLSLLKQFNKLRVADNLRYPAFFLYKGQKYILKIFKQN
tara:strand:+ start:2683 stop:3336 length:654 start_codon:yes stop_codon:yes gene_type:complete